MLYLFGIGLVMATAIAILTVVGCGFFTLVMALAIKEKYDEWKR
jgi:hypothetical protein